MNDCSSAPPPTALRSAITPDFDSLESFLAAVDARVESILSDPALGEAQGAALLGSLVEHRQRRTNALADPLAMFYLLARAHDRPVGALGERVGAGLLLYFFALRLIDKVQDDELAGTPYAPLGRDVATNCGLTLFFLATHELRAAGTFAGSQATARALDELVHFHSLRSSRGQYLDLVGADEPLTPGEALALARMKSSVFSMFCEAAAIVAGRCEGRGDLASRTSAVASYRALGDAISEIRQIVNDLFDLFGKDESADLAGRKWTVPLCVMLHGLTPEARAAWIARITRVDAREVGDFLYASGAMGRVVALIEAARARLHRIARALPCGGPELAALLGFIDGLVSPIYSPPALDDVEEPVRRAL